MSNIKNYNKEQFIVSMRENGLSLREIAKFFNISHEKVRQVLTANVTPAIMNRIKSRAKSSAKRAKK